MDSYDEANKELLGTYKKSNNPDGELNFLAANPEVKIKGTGTFLLSELEKRFIIKRQYIYIPIPVVLTNFMNIVVLNVLVKKM